MSRIESNANKQLRPFPSSLVPLFQSESKCETVLLKMMVHMNVLPSSTMNTNGGTVTVDLIRRSWVRFPPRSKEFSFTSSYSWVKLALNLHFRVNSLLHLLKMTLICMEMKLHAGLIDERSRT